MNDGNVYKWQSNIDLYLEHPEAAELTPQFIEHAKVLVDVFEEVQLLLRIDAFVCPVECFSTARPEGAPGLNISFVAAEKVRCKGHEGEYTGCAGQWDGYRHEGKWYLNRANIWVATEGLSSRQLRHVLMHEMLHALTLIGHAEHGIMALAASARSEGLTAMDTAQMWLYSNPLIQSGMSLDEVKLMVRYGAWDEPPPEFVDAVQRCLNQLQISEDYVLADPRTQAYLEYLCREEGRLGI